MAPLLTNPYDFWIAPTFKPDVLKFHHNSTISSQVKYYGNSPPGKPSIIDMLNVKSVLQTAIMLKALVAQNRQLSQKTPSPQNGFCRSWIEVV